MLHNCVMWVCVMGRPSRSLHRDLSGLLCSHVGVTALMDPRTNTKICPVFC
jgi:hypothetical protein